MSSRFFVDRTVSRWDSGGVYLTGDEAHHFSKVMRGKIGDSLVLFDGSGVFAYGIAEAIHKDGIQIRITETFSDTVESPLRLTVATALPKGDRQRFLIEKLAELGTARFVPISMERSVARANEAAIQRFRRYVIESAKQCGRNVLMEIADEISIEKLPGLFENESLTKYILHPFSLGQAGQLTAAQVIAEPLPEKIAILTGPEGSFTDHEVNILVSAGFSPLDLGKRILRTETACIAAASLFLSMAG